MDMTRILFACLVAAILAACQRQAPDAADAAPASAAPPVAVPAQEPAGPSAAPSPGDEAGVRSGPTPSTIALPPADTPTPVIAAGARVEYTCEDGNSLSITYGEASASVRLADGRVLALPRAGAPSGTGADIYAGDEAGLQRRGNVVQWQEAGGATRTCIESAASA